MELRDPTSPATRVHRNPVDRIFQRQYGVISRQQALAAGISPRSVDRKVIAGEWIVCYRGVYRISAVEVSWHQRLMAAYFHVGEPVAVSGRSAGALWSLEGIELSVVELTTPDFRRRRAKDFFLHSSDLLPNADLARVGPFKVTTPTRTLVDLGALISQEALEVALEDAFRRGISSPQRILARLEALSKKGRNGIGPLRDLMSKRAEGGAKSLLEVKTTRLLRQAGLPKPIRQYEVRLGPKTKAFIDLAYPQAMLAIELDGFKFHSDKSVFQKDRTRRNALTKLGWRTAQFTWDDVNNRPNYVIETVRALLGLLPTEHAPSLQPS